MSSLMYINWPKLLHCADVFLPARRCSSEVGLYAVRSFVCLSVCHKWLFYRKGWTDHFRGFLSTYLHCITLKFGQNKGFFANYGFGKKIATACTSIVTSFVDLRPSPAIRLIVQHDRRNVTRRAGPSTTELSINAGSQHMHRTELQFANHSPCAVNTPIARNKHVLN